MATIQPARKTPIHSVRKTHQRRFSLKNNAVTEAFEVLYLNPETSDVSFIFLVDKTTETVPANKAILATCSPVFKRIFYGPDRDKGNTKFHKAVVDPNKVDAFKEFLQFFYLTAVPLTMKHMEEVARLAKKYDICEYVNHCIAEFEVTLESLCWANQLSVSFGNRRMRDDCVIYAKIFTENIFASPAPCNCYKAILKHIMQHTIPYNNFELFYACLRWAQLACRRRRIDNNDMDTVQKQLDDRTSETDSTDKQTPFVLHPNGFAKRSSGSSKTQQKMKRMKSEYPVKSDGIISKKRTRPYSVKDIPRVMADNSPSSPTWSYCHITEMSPVARYLTDDPKMFFSISHPVILQEIGLKHLHCVRHNHFDFELTVRVFEHDDESFSPGVEKTCISIVIHIDRKYPVSEKLPICVFINPRKKYRITWEVLTRCYKTFYYDTKTRSMVRNSRNVKVKLRYDNEDEDISNHAEEFGIVRSLQFRHLFDLRW